MHVVNTSVAPYLLQVLVKPLLKVQDCHRNHQVQDYCHKTQGWGWDWGSGWCSATATG